MARPRSDGLPAKQASKKKLTDQLIKGLSSERGRDMVWDTKVGGLALAVYPTGRKVFKVIYSFGGRTRWYTIGRADQVDLDNARKLAAQVLLKVATDQDPQAERRADRSRGTFEELSASYVEQCAKRKNKSWPQADKLVRRFLVPRWGKLKASSISRPDVRAAMAAIESKSVANQTLAAASAIFSFAIRESFGGVTVNPCTKIERNEERERERILLDSEIPLFWESFDDAGLTASTALKVLLLLGQRPGEVCCMRREHIKDRWWQMPGKPMPEIGWPGTKNGSAHRVWLPAAALELINEIDPAAATGFVFASERGRAISNVTLSGPMRKICAKLGVERATPHDLRRTHGSTITGLGFGRDAMNRIQNHKEGGIASVYDRHGYAEENKKVMEAVASISGEADEKVVRAQFKR